MHYKTSDSSVLELPASCRAAADRMEQALRQEDTASCPAANLTESERRILSETEQRLCRELGRDIILVAYNKN